MLAVDLDLSQPKIATVWCQTGPEHNSDGKLVWDSFIAGRLMVEPNQNPELRITMTHSHLTGRERGEAPSSETVLSLETHKRVSLMELAAFAAALNALVQEVIAQGANDERFHGAHEERPAVRAVLDPRAGEPTQGAA